MKRYEYNFGPLDQPLVGLIVFQTKRFVQIFC
jgi:hypothetical protein